MYTLPSTLRIGVLRGGPSHEYDVSLQSGGNVLKHLSETHKPLDILISRNGVWHVNGIERSPDRILRHVDVVFNALHGAYGEDGKVQELLDHHHIPYTGSGKFASAVAMNKQMTKEMAKKAGVKTPLYYVVKNSSDLASEVGIIFKTFPNLVVLKPLSSGSSVGVVMTDTRENLAEKIGKILTISDSVLVEEFISGREATCGVIDNFRGQSVYSLPPIEIIPPNKSSFFDYDAKYSGESKEICPGNFSKKVKNDIENFAKLIHQTLNLRHYSRSDFIVHPRRGIYFLEVNTLPGMTKESLFPKSLESVGTKMKDFIYHLILLALNKK